jgi:dynein assembly factor 3
MWGSSFACPVASEKILLVGTLDPRFIISTIAQHPRVQFYVIENQAPVIARHVLLLDIFFMLQLPAQERIDLFLEVYANILLRDKTAQWINEYVSTLINHLVAPHPFLDFSLLKFRERDDIEFVFKFWRDLKKPFDCPRLWFLFCNSGSLDSCSIWAASMTPVKTLLTGIIT